MLISAVLLLSEAQSGQKFALSGKSRCTCHLLASPLSHADAGCAAAAPDTKQELSDSVEEIQNRRCPPLKRFKYGSSFAVKVNGSSPPDIESLHNQGCCILD